MSLKKLKGSFKITHVYECWIITLFLFLIRFLQKRFITFRNPFRKIFTELRKIKIFKMRGKKKKRNKLYKILFTDFNLFFVLLTLIKFYFAIISNVRRQKKNIFTQNTSCGVSTILKVHF